MNMTMLYAAFYRYECTLTKLRWFTLNSGCHSDDMGACVYVSRSARFQLGCVRLQRQSAALFAFGCFCSNLECHCFLHTKKNCCSWLSFHSIGSILFGALHIARDEMCALFALLAL